MTAQPCSNLVMIVEDDPDVRQSILEVLGDHAYEALHAANGKEAIDRLRGSQARPCVILLDIMMPVMDGFQFRALQQQDADLGTIPVVVLSAHANAHEAARKMNAAAALKKPVQLETLIEMVDRFCRPQAA